MPNVSTLTLNNGVELPALGLGVFQTPAEETRAAVERDLCRDRHIDTAAAYGNERQVGEAVRSSELDRSEVFLETKIWISDYGYEKTLHGFEKSARKLRVDQIDLLILHQALPSDFEATPEAYRALETLLGDGKVRAIGVSNFMVEHPTTLLERTTVVPAVNQIEVHPYFAQRDVQTLDAEHGILTQGLVPDRRHHLLPRRAAQQHPAGPGHRRHRKGTRQTPAQVMLRWHRQAPTGTTVAQELEPHLATVKQVPEPGVKHEPELHLKPEAEPSALCPSVTERGQVN